MAISRFSELEIATAYRGYVNGETWSALARRFSCSADTLRSLFEVREYQLPARPPGRLSPQRIELPSDPAKLAYIAGLIDGEGYISRNIRSDRPRPNCWWTWRVGIANTDLGMIDWLLTTVPGSARTKKRYRAVPAWPVNGERRPCYEWLVRGFRDVHALLIAVEPYLVVKGERARLAISEIGERLAVYDVPLDPQLLADADARVAALVATPASRRAG